MSGPRVTAIPYRSVIAEGQNSVNVWHFFVAVADQDGTQRVGLKKSNFAVRVHAQGTYGAFDPLNNSYIDQFTQQAVGLALVLEAKYAPGIYTLEAGEGDVTLPQDPPYVFSVSVTIPPLFPFPGATGATGRALASYMPMDWSDQHHGPSI
jgi:hypothetical protein